jgi:DNA-binding response OmpR family regulator
MHTINLLIGNANVRVTNLIYSLVSSVCGHHISLDCARVARVDDFLAEAIARDFDLIIMNPENLETGSDLFRGCISLREAEGAIRSIKTLRPSPIIAVAASPENELALSEAGADLVLGLPFNCEDLKSAVSRLLIMPEEQAEVAVAGPTTATNGFLRSWQRLTASLW